MSDNSITPNIQYVFQGSPKDTTYTINSSFWSTKYVLKCNEYQNLSFLWHGRKTQLILDDGRILLHSIKTGFRQYKVINMLTNEEYCEIAIKKKVYRGEYEAKFTDHMYSIQIIKNYLTIYKEGIEVANWDMGFRVPWVLKIKKNVDPAMVITITMTVIIIYRQQTSL
eukprot:NODE_127_length_17034_cov_0.369590.p13 type:complete len:168 gc:universal NODE_127_length_17034_cov_0.369590:3913-4416(+)